MIDVSSTHQFDALVRHAPRLVANFISTYCKACGFIAPKYDQLAAQHRNMIFVVVDVNAADNRALVARYTVTGMPTFLMFKRGTKVDEYFGLDEGALEERVKRLAL